MTVAIITSNYPPTICGVGDHTHHLVQALLKADVKTHVICKADQKPLATGTAQIHPIVDTWNRAGYQTALAALATIEPDWVVVQYVPHGFDPRGLPFGILGFYRQLSRRHYPILTVFHEVRVRPELKPATLFISAVETYIARQLVLQSRKVTASIDFYTDLLKNKPFPLARGSKGVSETSGHRSKIHIVPIGSGIPPVEATQQEKAQLRQRFDIPPTARLIATFGNRDISAYLPDFDKLAQKMPDMIWLLCGKNKTPQATIKSRPYLRHTGEMPAEDLYKTLSLSEIVFLPEPVNSKFQGGSCNKSTALATALSLGVPVVGVKGDLNNALLKHDKNILLVNLNEPMALYETLKYCLDTEGVSKRLGAGAKDLFDTALDWTVVGKQYLGLMNLKTTYPSTSALV
jgi:glycosyltransferase involved in cell wall biosynthesis